MEFGFNKFEYDFYFISSIVLHLNGTILLYIQTQLRDIINKTFAVSSAFHLNGLLIFTLLTISSNV